MKQDALEYVEYVVSLGLSVSKEQIDKAREGLELARVELER